MIVWNSRTYLLRETHLVLAGSQDNIFFTRSIKSTQISLSERQDK